ncbi:MAG: flavin reductase family protein [Sphingomonas sp.]|jgi:flavin reductase (DIM6/NTAB) family NADH-FMN oxidoreductase RutF|uniref:flavin reductase family protein n=1 Tax=Sphingomonas sp. TaxID=28214 RepID=UPI0035689B56
MELAVSSVASSYLDKGRSGFAVGNADVTSLHLIDLVEQFAGSLELPRTIHSATDARTFRDVLGCCPTSVAVITAQSGDDRLGLVVGSFTSISLDPPLVGFFPGRESRTWRKIEEAGRFCVNVLSARQAAVSKTFSSNIEDKFAGISHGVSPGGLPLLDGIAAWVECSIDHVQEIGDHFLVVGTVEAMGKGDGSPLVFLKGDYFAAHALQSI